MSIKNNRNAHKENKPSVTIKQIQEKPVDSLNDILYTDEKTKQFSRIRKIDINFKTESQNILWDLISENQITICQGPAGTGKSYVSIAKALDLLSNHKDLYKKIIFIKPVVEADEKLGFLPGTIEDKLQPFIFSTMYITEKILSKVKVDRLVKQGYIEVMALAYLRGVNIDNAILVCEEAQNTTRKQMKTLLTRIGENCKMIISGDIEQSDKFNDPKENGLYFAIEKLKNVNDIATFAFKPEDIVRNPIITTILNRFNGDC